MKIWKDAIQGLQFFAFILMAFVLFFSVVPVHAQMLPPEVVLEHRLTMNEQEISNLMQGFSSLQSRMDGLETKVMLAVSGIAMLLIKAAVNIFMEKFYPGSKPV